MLLAAVVLVASLTGDEMAPSSPAGVEGRPAAADLSPLQARIDAARDGDTIEVGPGTYRGDLWIGRRVALRGVGRPRLVGSGTGSVVLVRANGASIESFDVDGGGGGDLGRDSSGIHVAAHDVTIRGCRVTNSIFGVYLREADGAAVEETEIRGIPGREPGE